MDELKPEDAPKTCVEAVEKLLGMFEGQEQLNTWASMIEEDALIEAHHGLGASIRNNWGLWPGSALKSDFETRGIHHPDDMSSILLVSLHRKINGRLVNLDIQVRHYQNYWARQPKMVEDKVHEIKMDDGTVSRIITMKTAPKSRYDLAKEGGHNVD
jgi:hypothetical protein